MNSQKWILHPPLYSAQDTVDACCGYESFNMNFMRYSIAYNFHTVDDVTFSSHVVM